MLQEKVNQLIEVKNQYKQAYENLENILQKHGINTQSIQQIEKDLILFTNATDIALTQLEKKTFELNTERKNMKELLILHKEEINKLKEQQKDETTYYNDINNVNYNLYLQRLSTEYKNLRISASTTKCKEKDHYSLNDTLLQKQSLYNMNQNHALNSSFFNANGKNNSYNYPQIISPYSSLCFKIQSNNDSQNKDFSKTEQDYSSEFFEMRAQKMALDIALSHINDMDEEMMLMSNYNEKLQTRLLALEKNVSYSWREYT